MDRVLRNRIILLLIVSGVLGYVLVSLSGRQPVAQIAAVKPVRQNLASSISSNGKVEPIAPYPIRAQLVTFIERVYAVEGQPVKRGQLLLSLDVMDVRAQLAKAREQLLSAQDALRTARNGGRPDEAARVAGDAAKARAERDRLRKEHDTLTRLVAQQAATRDELAKNQEALERAEADAKRLEAAKQEFDRRVKLDAEQAELRVEQTRTEMTDLEEKVRSGRIAAPADGTLYSLPVKPGDFVKVGDLLAELADLRRVRVRAFIDEPELGSLEPNQPAQITWDALPGRTWQGRTEVVPKQVVAHGARSVGELLCTVSNDKVELLPNVNVNVRINSRERLNVLTAPRGAVQIEGGRRYVFVVENSTLGVRSKLEKREIQVGIANATNYEVTNGLGENALVALPGDVELKDGMAVRVVRTE